MKKLLLLLLLSLGLIGSSYAVEKTQIGQIGRDPIPNWVPLNTDVEKAKAKREAAKKQKEFAEKYPKLDYQYGNDADLAEILHNSNRKLYGETAANSVSSGNVDMAPNAGKKKKKSLKVIKRHDY